MIENLFPGGVVSLAAPGRATADCQCPVSGSLYNWISYILHLPPECFVNLSERQFEQQWLMGFVYSQLESNYVCKKHFNRVLVKVQVSSFEDQLNRILWDEKIRWEQGGEHLGDSFSKLTEINYTLVDINIL